MKVLIFLMVTILILCYSSKMSDLVHIFEEFIGGLFANGFVLCSDDMK
jgi:hypothetical protein